MACADRVFEVKTHGRGATYRKTYSGWPVMINGHEFNVHIEKFPRRACLSDPMTGDRLLTILTLRRSRDAVSKKLRRLFLWQGMPEWTILRYSEHYPGIVQEFRTLPDETSIGRRRGRKGAIT